MLTAILFLSTLHLFQNSTIWEPFAGYVSRDCWNCVEFLAGIP